MKKDNQITVLVVVAALMVAGVFCSMWQREKEKRESLEKTMNFLYADVLTEKQQRQLLDHAEERARLEEMFHDEMEDR